MDFLASFNLQEHDHSQADNSSCGSIDELQLRLRDVLGVKVTATRAEHVATNLDLAGTAQLTLGLSGGENNVLEGLNNVDPSLGGLRSTIVAAERNGRPAVRVVNASEALTNQPQDDPVLQRSVAKCIIAGVSAADGSEWTVREVSRGAQGWTFTYICKASFRHWSRQNKAHTKALIAEYSQKELDPRLSGRPAFDCRGSITISFSRHSRVISIKYDHTPLHKTVAQLAELLKPPHVWHPLPVVEKHKTPKTPKQSGSARKKRVTAKQQSENGKPRKRKRKTGDGDLPEGSGMDFGEPSQLDDLHDAASQLPLGSTHAYTSGPDGNELQALLENGSILHQGQAYQEADQPSAGGTLAINVSPEEAARRRNLGQAMLREAGVDLDSLSAEQFNIFANQSPELQKESLNMLVNYGAERLRIIHPGNKEGSAPSTPSTSATAVQHSIQTSASGPVTTNELVLQIQGVGSPRRRSRNKLAANGAADPEEGQQTETPKKSRRRGAKSRVACLQCKQRKVKCPHDTPTCAECQTAGLICEYSTPKPRRKKLKSAATVEDEGEETPREDGPEAGPEAEPEQAQRDEEEYSEMHPQMPVADILTANMNVTDWEINDAQSNYFPSSSNLTETNPSRPSHPTRTSSNLILPQGRLYYSAHAPAEEMQDEPAVQMISPKQSNSRHSMSTRPSQGESQQSPAMNATATPDWPPGGNAVTQAATASVTASSMQDESAGESGYGTWRAAALSQAALSQATLEDSQGSMVTAQQSSVVTAPIQRHGARSPMTDIPQTRSRQGKHASRSSLHDASVPQRPAASDQQSNNCSSVRQSLANINATSNYNSTSYDRYSDSRTTTGAASTSRIAYEPYSYQRDTSSGTLYTNYGHSIHATTTASSMPSQTTTTTMASSDQSSTGHYGSYSTPQSQNTSHTSHTNTTSYADSRMNTQDLGADQSRFTRQNFSMRPNAPVSRPSQGTMKQPERNYSSYSSHLQQPHQKQQSQQHTRQPLPQQQPQQQHNQTTQHHGWYNFDTQGNNSFTSSGNHGSNYSWSIPGEL